MVSPWRLLSVTALARSKFSGSPLHFPFALPFVGFGYSMAVKIWAESGRCSQMNGCVLDIRIHLLYKSAKVKGKYDNTNG